MGKFKFTKEDPMDTFKPDAITSIKSGQQSLVPMTEKYYKYFSKVHNDAVNAGKFIQTSEDNPVLNLYYEGHGLKKFTGKFSLTPTVKGVIKKDHDAGQKV